MKHLERKVELYRRAINRLIIENEELREQIEYSSPADQEDVKEYLDTIARLERQLSQIRCQGFPGEIELVVKDSGGEHEPTVEDLRRLCEANGLTVLQRGQYVCAECDGIRTTEECKGCEERGET